MLGVFAILNTYQQAEGLIMIKHKILGVILVSSLVALSGCGESASEEEKYSTGMEYVTAKRLDVEGVDCVIARGRFGEAVALSCDWNNKTTK